MSREGCSVYSLLRPAIFFNGIDTLDPTMSAAWNAELIAWMQAEAAAQGFDRAGVAPALEAADAAAAQTAERFAAWIDAGRAGEMQYLSRRAESGELLRSSARAAMPWARSVVVCALNYNLGPEATPRSIDPALPGSGWIARYAWTGDADGQPLDYHDELLRRLRAIEAALQAQTPCQTRCYVDTGPVLERDFAARAGIGWIGKNTCVLNQELGSWLLLGVLVTDIPVAATLAVAPDRCGSCTRCLDACPTSALVAPREMDASLCIAYLTIEKKGGIPLELREPMGRQVFGCDICQDVCPWNRKAPLSTVPGMARRDDLINPSLAWLASLDAAGFKREFASSPLERTKRKRLHRNVAIAMGNSGDPSFVPQLEAWAQSDDVPLRDAAAWALEKLRAAALC
jgi:epoxyqueuosine reductase